MQINRDILLWLKSISKKSGLIKSLSFKNISLWWFNEFPLLVFIMNAIRNNQDITKNIFGVDIYRLRHLVTFYFGAKAILLFILSKLLIRSKPQKSSGKKQIMVVSISSVWRAHPQLERGGEARSQDVIFSDVITMLRGSNCNVVALYEDGSLLIDLKALIEREKIDKGLWMPVEAYLTLDILRTAFRASRRFKKEWDRLKNNREFIDSLNYKGMPLFDSLKDYLAMLFEQRTFSQVLLIELMEKAIKIEKPHLILVAGENLSVGKAAVIVGKWKGVPTLAIQHGTINMHLPEYLHTKDEVSDKIDPEYCPLPDKIAVYGPWTKRLLIQDCNYPEDRVVVTGQPRYDVLTKADKIFSKEEFCQRYGLDLNKKIALICTENLSIFEENIVFLRGILKALKEFPDVQIIIKPHQREKGRWYERIAREEKADAVIMAKKSNTYEAMYACDVMLAFFSTTITEALILNKPVVVVNLTGEPDPVPYVESGVAIGAYKQEDIAPAVKDALYNEDVILTLAQARKDFVYQHAYIQDGQATERVTELINQMLGV